MLPNIEKTIETHLSRVLISQDYVFKFKKPVKFTFVDYSSFEKRYKAAVMELELNRRCTHNMYYGILYCNFTSDGKIIPCLGEIEPSAVPSITTDDVAVVMKRLDQNRFLDTLIEIKSDQMSEYLKLVADQIAKLHKANRLQYSSINYVERTNKLIRENFVDLEKPEICAILPELTKRIILELKVFTDSLLENFSKILAKRFKSGLFVDGHGDLRLEHIAIEEDVKPTIQIFDCVEFSGEIRHCDLAADLAFLVMDLEKRLRPDLGAVLTARYQEVVRFANLDEVLRLFKMYRALVRAKVHALRCRQLQGDSAQTEIDKVSAFVALASRYRFENFRPCLILICGLSGSGKTTLAKDLDQYLHIPPLSADVIRKQILGPGDYKPGAPFGQGIYTQEATEKTYSTLLDRAKELLLYGNSVILDASFMRREHRSAASALARNLSIPVILLECTLSEKTSTERLAKRQKARSNISDAGPETLKWQEAQWERILPNEFNSHYVISTEGPKHAAVREALELLAANRYI